MTEDNIAAMTEAFGEVYKSSAGESAWKIIPGLFAVDRETGKIDVLRLQTLDAAGLEGFSTNVFTGVVSEVIKRYLPVKKAWDEDVREQ